MAKPGAVVDFYRVLNVSKTATAVEIKKAYRALALKHHPDRNLQDKQKHAKVFNEVSNAYQVLGNIKSKREYDNLIGNVTKFTNNRHDDWNPSQQYGATEKSAYRREPITREMYNQDAWKKAHFSKNWAYEVRYADFYPVAQPIDTSKFSENQKAHWDKMRKRYEKETEDAAKGQTPEAQANRDEYIRYAAERAFNQMKKDESMYGGNSPTKSKEDTSSNSSNGEREYGSHRNSYQKYQEEKKKREEGLKDKVCTIN